LGEGGAKSKTTQQGSPLGKPQVIANDVWEENKFKEDAQLRIQKSTMQEYLIMKNETTKLKLLQFIIERNIKAT